ncbi:MULTISPECIES: ABC transporter ATP-binding protein [unclassified Pantoea]|jgi:peptide/nickel transport system ATP-binding protein|uniref:ABC transporter ATP-binding protein n=1 Tax=unclassified Pantoea TaxID=2630326 RepID=UPI001CD1A9F0|nr:MULTISPECIES: ABC transporter ATP-binding protein [unclassified Pantoea]MCA1177881.1 ABC transporter ATP-binding protein [Pantoea sp. alder69]MCA1251979.1 ABC transporter ATP-binding protein [Pantoea sp. alder70]MCA1266355.1 ABC transporter ATP-binding protein [Pantoea sp. alder81]
MNNLLQVKNLNIVFRSAHGEHRAVRDVSFHVGREKVAIVGESGSGKSQTCRALLQLTPKIGRVTADQMQFDDIDLLNSSEKQMRQIRGNRISMILQDPRFSLNPLMRIGDQVAEAFRLHRRVSKSEARARASAMLESVHIRDVGKVARLYPHEISGGMGQRVMIAMMLIPEPDLIIADEPTSALDVTVRQQVLSILNEQLERRQTGLLFISHDLNLVSRFCDRVLVMYAGRIVEEIRADRLEQAQHPYTQALLASQPRLHHPLDTLRVPTRDASWLNGPCFRDGVAL